jgi:signal transduction histidine kinase
MEIRRLDRMEGGAGAVRGTVRRSLRSDQRLKTRIRSSTGFAHRKADTSALEGARASSALSARRHARGSRDASAALLLALMHSGLLPQLWWWAQGGTLALGAAALVVIRHSQRIAPTPFAVVVRRFGIVALGTFALVTFAAAAAAGEPGVPLAVVAFGSIVWYLFYASLLLLVPFLAKSRQVLREFALVAGISTVATSLDLLFVAVLSLGQFMSLALALFLSLGIYAGAREWIVRQLVGAAVPTTERTFEQLYRAARAVQEQPGRHADALAQLLRELYEPLELQAVGRRAAESQVYGGGASMLVPLRSADDALPVPPALALRYARRGKRLFTDDDARLADRVVEQFRRAVAYDLAVERGRAEERLRIAQDLHDDIGARLLTLMYQAQSPEMEEYIRHTLQDLKTLTRGLATAEHRLSHAAAEWKADLAQRLAAAHIDLEWSLEFDVDLRLDVVTWSALTRVLRELASNVIAHAQASRMDVTLSVVARGLRLVVADDGRGREPQAWSHGLGLGGIRKRVKLLGGEVRWREQTPRGIACEVRVVDLGARR